MEQLKKLLEKFKIITDSRSKKKLIENSVIAIIIGIILIITAGTLFGGGNKEPEQKTQQSKGTEFVSKQVIQDEGGSVQKEMEALLSQVAGAGKVDVMITYETGKESVPATNVKRNDNSTQEKDTSGGTRDITQNDFESSVVYEEGQGTKKPVILKEIQPKVKGVVIIADGADNPVVKESLCNAAKVLLNVEIHKIEVLQRSR